MLFFHPTHIFNTKWISLYSQRFAVVNWMGEDDHWAECSDGQLLSHSSAPKTSFASFLSSNNSGQGAWGHEGIHSAHRCCYEFQLPTFTWVTFQSEVCLLLTYHHQLSISCNDGCKLASWIPLRAQPSSSLTHFPYCTYTAETWQETEFKQVDVGGLDWN